ncbi:hypothetical protein [Candidatus Mycoplasma haematohominis]|uniref:Uncharacterized protein n=1 Tax=Candidatus Mycoplasma haematohominis TaxID=1494318 RepID=A0A478FUA5_9MOLU|nr:hypothetical protein [Candidatus Mycoplasma haemohominis]GCE63916.1 hypothetical protein MHSWG343_09230 [Candidatus Mycoplasma haemohominis]
MLVLDALKSFAMSAVGAATGAAGSFGYNVITNQEVSVDYDSLNSEIDNLKKEAEELEKQEQKLENETRERQERRSKPKDLKELCEKLKGIRLANNDLYFDGLDEMVKENLPNSTFNARKCWAEGKS